MFVQLGLISVSMFGLLIVFSIVATAHKFSVFVNVNFVARFLIGRRSTANWTLVIDAIVGTVTKWCLTRSVIQMVQFVTKLYISQTSPIVMKNC